MIGILTISDKPRADTRKTIERANELGVTVRMITGDAKDIAKWCANEVGLKPNIMLGEDFRKHNKEERQFIVKYTDG